MNSECTDILAELESWYARENGQYLLEMTRVAMQDLLDTSFGYHILQLGITGGRPLCQSSPINHRIYVAERPGVGVGLLAHADELPLDSDSIDTVIAHHCLEFAPNPHQVLREIQRVLTPQGQLLVIGFNPYSLLGVNTYLRGLSHQSLWKGHNPVGEKRLTDWLRLLGCEVQDIIRLYGVPLAGGGKLRQCLMRGDAWSQRNNLPFGGLYILHAIKQVSAVHRPRLQLRSHGKRLIGLVPKPAPAPTPTPTTQKRKPIG
ncbi:MAG: class I SAM-dependent methyltransferase [Gammaproteobacteria bacterium]|nr:MAG: class I SAM-dependent methyltransferase [Gammaproteobacteria bacterium]